MAKLVVAAIAAAVLALWLARVVRAWRASWIARRRAARAGRGEDRAARLLAAAGYLVVERQARVAWAPLVDGEPFAVELRADYLCTRADERNRAGGSHGDRLFVAEVKTGDDATSLSTAATRRQLLEYYVAFAADGVLLVCPERGTIEQVEFPIGRLGLDRPRSSCSDDPSGTPSRPCRESRSS